MPSPSAAAHPPRSRGTGAARTPDPCHTDVVSNEAIVLDGETARGVRLEAARQGTGVSRLVGVLIREQMAREARHERARRFHLARPPAHISPDAGADHSREEVHRR